MFPLGTVVYPFGRERFVIGVIFASCVSYPFNEKIKFITNNINVLTFELPSELIFMRMSTWSLTPNSVITELNLEGFA